MAGQGLTRDEVFALAGAFSVGLARTLLSLARFPSWAVPEAGYAIAREFWAKLSEQLEVGVMPGGRVQILEAARDWFPANEELAALAAAAGPAPASSARAALRVLVIGASPVDADLPHVRADREARVIERWPSRAGWRSWWCSARRRLTCSGWGRSARISCISSVMGPADSLVLSDAGGESDYVAAARVAQRLQFYRDKRGVRQRGGVLAVCDGQTLAPCFAGVADTVIAHRGKLADQCGVAFAGQFYTLLSAPAGPAALGHAVAGLTVPDLAGVAREAAQLTAQYSAACDPVIANLIVLHDGG